MWNASLKMAIDQTWLVFPSSVLHLCLYARKIGIVLALWHLVYRQLLVFKMSNCCAIVPLFKPSRGNSVEERGCTEHITCITCTACLLLNCTNCASQELTQIFGQEQLGTEISITVLLLRVRFKHQSYSLSYQWFTCSAKKVSPPYSKDFLPSFLLFNLIQETILSQTTQIKAHKLNHH